MDSEEEEEEEEGDADTDEDSYTDGSETDSEAGEKEEEVAEEEEGAKEKGYAEERDAREGKDGGAMLRDSSHEQSPRRFPPWRKGGWHPRGHEPAALAASDAARGPPSEVAESLADARLKVQQLQAEVQELRDQVSNGYLSKGWAAGGGWLLEAPGMV